MKHQDFPLFVRNMLRHEVLPLHEVHELITRSQRGDKKATDKLVEHNMKMVASIAKRYSFAMPIEDLIQEGVLGLMRAISSFDVNTNNRLSTYAKMWIIAYVKRAAQHNSGFTAFTEARNRNMVKKVDGIVQSIHHAGNDDSGNGLTLEETISDNSEQSDVSLHRKDISEKVREEIEAESTDPRDQRLARRIADPEDLTLAKLGDEFGVSRERVRQLEMKLKERLKKSPQMKKLARSA